MSLLQALTEKPWQQTGIAPTVVNDASRHRRIGLRVLLTVISVLFFLFIVAFLMRSQYPDWQPLAEEPIHPLYDQSILMLNSLYLLLASVFVQWAKVSATKDKGKTTNIALLLGGLFAGAFIAGQLAFWQQLNANGFFVNTNPAISFFYLFTGLHAAHMAIGIGVWLFALAASVKQKSHRAELVSLCASYWHFLLGLWILLFVLLTSKPETYNAIAEFCGLR